MTQNSTETIEVRRIPFEFPDSIDRYWFSNNIFKTHLFNSFTIILPELEKYLIFNMKQRLNLINNNPQLQQAALAFIGQEGQHALQHKKFWDNLNSSGYRFAAFLKFIDVFLTSLSKFFSNEVNLAIGAGFEHLTILIATFALEEDFFAEAEPQLKNLFEWHCIEEVEHKSVIFDVLIDANNNYWLRVIIMIFSHILGLTLLNLCFLILIYQDRKLLNIKIWRNFIQFWLTKDKLLLRTISNALQYCRKDFHPSQTNYLSKPINIRASELLNSTYL